MELETVKGQDKDTLQYMESETVRGKDKDTLQYMDYGVGDCQRLGQGYIVVYRVIDWEWLHFNKVISSDQQCQHVPLSITNMFVIDHKKVFLINHKIVCD